MRSRTFFLLLSLVALALFWAAMAAGNDYLLFAGYVVLQYIVLATAWNILGGYCGYVNFGTAAFFALGVYSAVTMHKLGANLGNYLPDRLAALLGPLFPVPIPVMMIVGGIVAGIVGFGMGYLTLRLRGAFFAIGTLAMAVVLQTLVINWDFVGGSRGAYIIRPDHLQIGAVSLGYIGYLFLLMLILAVLSLVVARAVERSRLGYGFAAIRDDEMAAEAAGVPTLRLKLIATSLSGAMMGMAGVPFPYYIGYVEPTATFGLPYAVNAIAMPMIGGTTSWIGPLVGAVLLGSLQQIANVTISSVVNLLIVGVLLVAFVIAAPVGIIGLIQEFLRVSAPARLNTRSVLLVAIAVYAFLNGIMGIIFNLSDMQSGNALVALLGIVGLVVGALNLSAAYSLLKLAVWAPVLTMFALLASALFAAAQLLWERPVEHPSLRWATIAIAVGVICYLQTRDVRQLYGRRPVAAVVTA